MQATILFYKFINVDDPHAVRKWQTVLCAEHGLNGRIIIAKEGINATLGGDKEALESYIYNLETDERFRDIHYKWGTGGYESFPKLSIKVRDELVTMSEGRNFDTSKGGKHLKPKEWHDMIANDPNVVVVDGRNKYEANIGKFKDAVVLDTETFKDFPEELKKLEDKKDKKVLTYCTGGVRCETLSVKMKEMGFDDVYQLDGGIVTYGEEYGDDGFWEGKCFVFDERKMVAFSDKSKDIGDCHYCEGKTSRYINCANKLCNKLMLVCEDCDRLTTCSKACEQKVAQTA